MTATKKRYTTVVAITTTLFVLLFALTAHAAWTLRDSGPANQTLFYDPSILDCPTGQTVHLRTTSSGFGPYDSTGTLQFYWQSASGNGSATYSDDFDLEPSGAKHVEQHDTGKNNITYARATPGGLNSAGDFWFYTQCF
jgi:hypothetical protein